MTTSKALAPAVSVLVFRELYERSGASRWSVTFEVFSARLQAAVNKRFAGETPVSRELDAFVRALHVEDVALAMACTAGHEAAWEQFVRELRPGLHAAGRAIASGDAGEELADSLLAELYGVDAKGVARRSLLDYFHGRSKLATWLRTVAAQRHVDRVRERAKTVSLDDEQAPSGQRLAEANVDEGDPHRADYIAFSQRALDEALAALPDADRLRLRLYYGQGLKLAAIGRLMGEHEATVSRKLEKVRRHLRRDIEQRLRSYGLAEAAIPECLAQAASAPELDLSRATGPDAVKAPAVEVTRAAPADDG